MILAIIIRIIILVKIASERGLTGTVQLLLQNGASMNMTDLIGRTALFFGKETRNLFR